MHLPAGFLAGFGQGLEEIVPVNTSHPGINAQLARHGLPCAESAAQVKQKTKEYMG
jgi:hypothetical protein